MLSLPFSLEIHLIQAQFKKSITFDFSFSSDDAKVEKGNESDSSIDETAEEKRVRLAKEYIAKLEEEGKSKTNVYYSKNPHIRTFQF